MNIQQSINQALGIAAKGAVAARGLHEAEKAAGAKQAEQAAKAAQEAEKAKKTADAENLKALGAVPDYQATLQKSEGAGQVISELGGQSADIQAKIERQRELLQQEGLSPRQAARHKGYITRMQEAQANVEEQAEARQYQKKLLDKRLEVLRSIHGEAWGRMGVDPEGGIKDGGK